MLSSFAQFQKAITSFVCLSVSPQNNSIPTGRIFTKIYIRSVFKIYRGNSSLIKI